MGPPRLGVPSAFRTVIVSSNRLVVKKLSVTNFLWINDPDAPLSIRTRIGKLQLVSVDCSQRENSSTVKPVSIVPRKRDISFLIEVVGEHTWGKSTPSRPMGRQFKNPCP